MITKKMVLSLFIIVGSCLSMNNAFAENSGEEQEIKVEQKEKQEASERLKRNAIGVAGGGAVFLLMPPSLKVVGQVALKFGVGVASVYYIIKLQEDESREYFQSNLNKFKHMAADCKEKGNEVWLHIKEKLQKDEEQQ